MCKPSVGNSAAIVQAQQEAMKEQLNKNNVLLSNEKTASTTGEKVGNKRTVSSLRVPLKNMTDTQSTGLNTTDITVGLNIPV